VAEIIIEESVLHTSIHRRTLNNIADLYGVSVTQLAPMSGGHANHVYEYQDGSRNCVLRVTPPNKDTDLKAMRSILEWLAFLGSHGGPVPCPLRSRKDNLIELVDQDGQVYIAVAFEKAPGILAENMELADWTDGLFQSLGDSLGSCHRIAREYVPREEYKRPDWTKLTNCFHPEADLEGADPLILDKYAQVLSLITKLPKDKESYGLAHLDLHFGNFFIDAGTQKITLIDFDDCAHGWYIMDIAMLLFDVLVVYSGPDPNQFGKRFLQNLLTGYRRQKPIQPFWLAQLPVFLKLLEISLYLMLYRSFDPASPDGWSGKFMPGRREQILREIPYVELNFNVV
jgi:Ser/Thr protein kinase RdoA (MazF antagonist)